MPDADKTVFLSYRREVSWAMAHLVRNDLVTHGFDVFMDVGSIDSGEFEPVILREIGDRAHFLLLLEDGPEGRRMPQHLDPSPGRQHRARVLSGKDERQQQAGDGVI